jgi:replicative DNA helicase
MNDPKIPPHDDVAEQSVLGAILIDKDAMVDVAEFCVRTIFIKKRMVIYLLR